MPHHQRKIFFHLEDIRMIVTTFHYLITLLQTQTPRPSDASSELTKTKTPLILKPLTRATPNPKTMSNAPNSRNSCPKLHPIRIESTRGGKVCTWHTHFPEDQVRRLAQTAPSYLFPNLAHRRRKITFICKHVLTSITTHTHMIDSPTIKNRSIRGIIRTGQG